MESRYKLTMCRLCLCENECYLNIFEVNDWQGYVPAEVISDLLQFQVSKTDCYPHVVCSACLRKLTEFRLFKECCLKSKDTYDDMLVSNESPGEHNPEMVTIKSEEVIIDSSSYKISEDPLNTTEVSYGPILLKYDVLPFSRDSHQQEELIESDVTGTQGIVESTEALMQDSSQVKLTSLETVTHPKYQQCLDYKRSQCTSKGETDADSCSLSIRTNDASKNLSLSEDFEASSSGTIERLKEQSISPGEYVAVFFQQDISIGKEVKKKRGRMEADKGEGEGRRTGPEKSVRKRKEGLECFHCGIVLMSKPSLIRHMEVHGFVESYDCTICGKVFHFNYELKRHVLTHKGSEPYKCMECNKCFSQNSKLKEHMRTHAGSKLYKCTECSKSFRRKYNLVVHMRSHIGSKPYKCMECSKCFSQNSNLKKHARIHSGSKPHKCAECSKCFSQSSNLKKHMRTHTGSKPHKCTKCSKCFAQNYHLIEHIRTHTGTKPFKCADCSKCFGRNYSLIVHMRSHEGSKPYKCMECSKCFSHISNLKKHMGIHTHSKPHKCTVCSKCFSQNSNLKKHMSIHSGSKPHD